MKQKSRINTRTARILGVLMIVWALFFGFLRVRVLSLGYAEGLTPPFQFVPFMTGAVLGMGLRLLYAKNGVNGIVATMAVFLTLIFLVIEEYLIAQGAYMYLMGEGATSLNQMGQIFAAHLKEHPPIFLWLVSLGMATYVGVAGNRMEISDEKPSTS